MMDIPSRDIHELRGILTALSATIETLGIEVGDSLVQKRVGELRQQMDRAQDLVEKWDE